MIVREEKREKTTCERVFFGRTEMNSNRTPCWLSKSQNTGAAAWKSVSLIAPTHPHPKSGSFAKVFREARKNPRWNFQISQTASPWSVCQETARNKQQQKQKKKTMQAQAQAQPQTKTPFFKQLLSATTSSTALNERASVRSSSESYEVVAAADALSPEGARRSQDTSPPPQPPPPSTLNETLDLNASVVSIPDPRVSSSDEFETESSTGPATEPSTPLPPSPSPPPPPSPIVPEASCPPVLKLPEPVQAPLSSASASSASSASSSTTAAANTSNTPTKPSPAKASVPPSTPTRAPTTTTTTPTVTAKPAKTLPPKPQKLRTNNPFSSANPNPAVIALVVSILTFFAANYNLRPGYLFVLILILLAVNASKSYCCPSKSKQS